MRKSVVIVLADGFEEIEAVTPIDTLRRAGVEVIIAGVGKTEVKGSRGIKIIADITLEEYRDLPDAVILPGAIPGAENLHNSKAVADLIQRMRQGKKIIAAICAAPGLVLAPLGVLEGKKATGYPGYEKAFSPATAYVEKSIVRDGDLITSRGPGTALEFSLELVRALVDDAMAAKLASAMIFKS